VARAKLIPSTYLLTLPTNSLSPPDVKAEQPAEAAPEKNGTNGGLVEGLVEKVGELTTS
jgi:L-rhamnonate dehydratase